MKSHLCGLTTSESARSTPAKGPAVLLADHGRPGVGRVDVEPGTGLGAERRDLGDRVDGACSTSFPTVATTAAASPLAAAPRPGRPGGAGTRRRPRSCTSGSSSSRAALSTEEWACSEQRTLRLGRRWRAAASAARVEVEAVSSMCPCSPSGRPRSWRSQSTATSSSSVAAGEVRQSIAFTFSAAVRNSARIPGSLPEMAKYAKKRGWFQWVIPGRRISSRSRSTAENGSARSGGDAGSAALIFARLDLREDRQLAHALQVAGDPLGGRGRIVRGSRSLLHQLLHLRPTNAC